MIGTLETIPAGNAGLAIKLQRLRGMVAAAKVDPAFRRLVAGVVRNVREKDWQGEAHAIGEWVRRGVRYVHDPAGVELFTEPQALASAVLRGEAAGDCDDAAVLTSAMLETIGRRTRFVVGGHGTAAAPAWAHIWSEWQDPAGTWNAIDNTAKTRPIGWRPDERFATILRESEQETTMQDLRIPSSVDLRTWPIELGGLGKLKLKKLKKKFKAMHNPKAHLKALKRGIRSKTFQKIAPVVAIAANVIPGVGQAVSAGVAAAAAAGKMAIAKRQRQQQQQQAAAAERAWQAEQAAMEAATAAEPAYQAPAYAEPAYAEPAYQAPAYAEPAYQATAYAEPAYQEPAADWNGLGFDWSSLLTTTTQLLPAVTTAAAGGAFGRRVAKAAGRASPAMQVLLPQDPPRAPQQQQQHQQQSPRAPRSPQQQLVPAPRSPQQQAPEKLPVGLLLAGAAALFFMVRR